MQCFLVKTSKEFWTLIIRFVVWIHYVDKKFIIIVPKFGTLIRIFRCRNNIHMWLQNIIAIMCSIISCNFKFKTDGVKYNGFQCKVVTCQYVIVIEILVVFI